MVTHATTRKIVSCDAGALVRVGSRETLDFDAAANLQDYLEDCDYDRYLERLSIVKVDHVYKTVREQLAEDLDGARRAGILGQGDTQSVCEVTS